MSKDVMRHNPVSLIETSTERKTKTKWDRASVKAFLSTAYSQWRWRSIGLIVHMAYDWGQRTGDMRTLTWDALDLDQCRMDLTQSKRGADVQAHPYPLFQYPVAFGMHRQCMRDP